MRTKMTPLALGVKEEPPIPPPRTSRLHTGCDARKTVLTRATLMPVNSASCSSEGSVQSWSSCTHGAVRNAVSIIRPKVHQRSINCSNPHFS